MTIHMVIAWWEHKPGTFEPDYEKPHGVTITGDTPAECMAQYNAIRNNHDCAENTPTQILGIY